VVVIQIKNTDQFAGDTCGYCEGCVMCLYIRSTSKRLRMGFSPLTV
jgi:hypothetical protein